MTELKRKSLTQAYGLGIGAYGTCTSPRRVQYLMSMCDCAVWDQPGPP